MKPITPKTLPSPASPERWTLWTGWSLCVLAVVVLSVALGQVLRTTTRGLHLFRVPGQETLTLTRTGLYIGLYPGGPKDAVRDLAPLEFDLAGADNQARIPVMRLPGAAVSLGAKSGVLLFQTEVPWTGRYVLTARYLEGRSGPEADAWLVHESLAHNRADLVAGVIVASVLAGFGIYLLLGARRRARSRAPGQRNP
jgi:hypothetical protein